MAKVTLITVLRTWEMPDMVSRIYYTFLTNNTSVTSHELK